MKFDHSIEGKIELESAIAKIIETGRILQKEAMGKEEKFELAWELGFVHLQNLENYRKPD